jgi:hypothetical protein
MGLIAMKTTIPGHFGTKRPLNLKAISEKLTWTLWASGYLERHAGAWHLTTRGQTLYYFV